MSGKQQTAQVALGVNGTPGSPGTHSGVPVTVQSQLDPLVADALKGTGAQVSSVNLTTTTSTTTTTASNRSSVKMLLAGKIPASVAGSVQNSASSQQGLSVVSPAVSQTLTQASVQTGSVVSAAGMSSPQSGHPAHIAVTSQSALSASTGAIPGQLQQQTQQQQTHQALQAPSAPPPTVSSPMTLLAGVQLPPGVQLTQISPAPSLLPTVTSVGQQPTHQQQTPGAPLLSQGAVTPLTSGHLGACATSAMLSQGAAQTANDLQQQQHQAQLQQQTQLHSQQQQQQQQHGSAQGGENTNVTLNGRAPFTPLMIGGGQLGAAGGPLTSAAAAAASNHSGALGALQQLQAQQQLAAQGGLTSQTAQHLQGQMAQQIQGHMVMGLHRQKGECDE